MRIRRLDLKAFGPFTDTVLDFSGDGSGGLHIIYGANEAGKSSARRALRDLLFGFEPRTPDNHLHPYDALRVGALLDLGDGPLYVERRKARKGSLRDARGEVLDEAVLERVLRGLDRDGYTRTFGLGHEELKTGGEELARGEASIGETLFDAGAGGPGVKRLREALSEEGERLYKKKGKLQELNVLLEQHAEAKRRCQDAVLNPETHRQQREELAAKRAELGALATRIETLRAEQYRVRGLLSALPGLQIRSTCLAELVSLGSVPDLPPGSREQREQAQTLEAEARARVKKITEELDRARGRLAEIEVPEALLALGAARVEALADAIGRTRKAREDLPRLERKKQQASGEMAERLRRLGRDVRDLGPLGVSAADGARIQKLATDHATLEERLVGANRRAAETGRELAELRMRLARTQPEHDLDALARVASLARSLGDIEGPLAERQRESRAIERALEARLREIPFDGTAGALAALSVPSPELVARLSEERAELRRRERELSEEAAVLSRRLAECTAKLAGFTATEGLPSVRELETARTERDGAWTALGSAWEAGAPYASRRWQDTLALGERADAVADRLRREADRVADHAHAEAERATFAAEAERVAEERRSLALARSEHESVVRRLSDQVGGAATTPEEISGFLGRRVEALALLSRSKELAEELGRLTDARAALEHAVTEALGARPKGSLSFAVEQTAKLELEERGRQSERAELERTLDGLSARELSDAEEIRLAEASQAAWRSAWAEALSALGVTAALEPAAALTLLAELGALAAQRQNVESLEARIQGIRRDEAQLAADVADPAALLGLAVEETAPDAAADEIVRRFHAAIAARDEQARLGREIREREEELAVQSERLAAATRSLDGLARIARVADPNELAAVEERSARARSLRQRLEAIEGTLIADGRSVSTLVAETEHETAPRLQARLDELEREIGEADEERARVVHSIASIEGGLATQSEGVGADALQEEQALLAAVRERVERYTRVKLAEVLLERAVERYRLTNQGPVLRRAGELFATLTDGAYESLRVGREEEVIVAVTPDGRELSRAALSEGTRYQLYFCLRLASIERHLSDAEPIPLVLDDAIIHFDEARKARAFLVLSKLSRALQILFFTHLESDLTIARAALSRNGDALPGVFFHDLKSAAGNKPVTPRTTPDPELPLREAGR
jgi:uncharacterized protein YhaN